MKNTAPESSANQPTKLTNNPSFDHENDTQPDWSPDGTKIAFSSSGEGGVGHIYVMDAADNDGDGNGDNRTTLAFSNVATDAEPSFSPEGTKGKGGR